MWKRKKLNVKESGEYLYLDSGTLTPVLKKLESKRCITLTSSKNDRNNLVVTLTDDGIRLKKQAVEIPILLKKYVKLKLEEMDELYKLLYKMLNNMTE
ncbi:hypothetical protein ACSVC9_05270 [Clostridium sp. LBM24168]